MVFSSWTLTAKSSLCFPRCSYPVSVWPCWKWKTLSISYVWNPYGSPRVSSTKEDVHVFMYPIMFDFISTSRNQTSTRLDVCFDGNNQADFHKFTYRAESSRFSLNRLDYKPEPEPDLNLSIWGHIMFSTVLQWPFMRIVSFSQQQTNERASDCWRKLSQWCFIAFQLTKLCSKSVLSKWMLQSGSTGNNDLAWDRKFPKEWCDNTFSIKRNKHKAESIHQ